MKRFLLRFLLLYILANVVLAGDLVAQHQWSGSNLINRDALVGIGGIFVYLFGTRLGSGSVDDSPLVYDEDREARRETRRAWLFAAMTVAIVLLLTEAIYMIFKGRGAL